MEVKIVCTTARGEMNAVLGDFIGAFESNDTLGNAEGKVVGRVLGRVEGLVDGCEVG